jgi:hypothetical protein
MLFDPLPYNTDLDLSKKERADKSSFSSSGYLEYSSIIHRLNLEGKNLRQNAKK